LPKFSARAAASFLLISIRASPNSFSVLLYASPSILPSLNNFLFKAKALSIPSFLAA
jgi:hypothetical protein